MEMKSAQGTVVGACSEHVDALLHWSLDPEIDNTTGGFHIQAAA
jgi:hypothetical protein